MNQATKQAPDAESAAADGSESSKRKTVSKRLFIDSNGAEVDKIEEATGMRYTLLGGNSDGSNLDFDEQLGPAGSLVTMAAIFGLQTKIGNVANTVLNDKEEPGTPADAAKAIATWLVKAKDPTAPVWAERGEGGVGARVDKDALAGAFVAVAISEGKATPDQEGTLYATVRERLESGWADKSLTAAQYATAIRKVPAVAAEYATRVGKAAKSLDDLL